MSSRALQIVTQLSNAPEQTMTSQELAERIGVSAHTIKNEMPQVAQILNENGARLVSRRHKGYYVEVLDPEAYDTFSAVTSIRQMPGSMLNADRESRVRYLSRRIISTETGIKKEQLADQLFLSASALREPLSMATRLCESFGLRIVSRPGTGMRVEGEEYKRRLALTEVSGVHFHKETLDCSDPDSASWLSCGYEERQDIRHTFLKILRESPISLRDSATQRVAVYLIIARNRVQNGHEIRLPDPWLESISGTMFYPLAQSIYHTLEEQYGGYAMPRDEVAFLGILLFSMLDVNLKRDPFSLHPGFAGQAGRLRDRVLVYLKQETGLDFALLPMARDLLQQILFNLIAQHFYGMDGAMQYDYVYELQFLDCPLCAEEPPGDRIYPDDLSGPGKSVPAGNAELLFLQPAARNPVSHPAAPSVLHPFSGNRVCPDPDRGPERALPRTDRRDHADEPVRAASHRPGRMRRSAAGKWRRTGRGNKARLPV